MNNSQLPADKLESIRLHNLRANRHNDTLTANRLAALAYVGYQGYSDALVRHREHQAKRFERFTQEYMQLLSQSPAYQSATVFVEAGQASEVWQPAFQTEPPVIQT